MDAHAHSRSTTRRTHRVVVGALALIVLAPVFIRALTMDGRFIDIDVYIGAADTVLRGGDLYSFATDEGFHFNYPPFAALFLLPLGMLPKGLVYGAWSASVLPLLALTVVAAGAPAASAWAERRGISRRTALLVMVLVLAWTVPVWKNIGYGQIGMLLTAMVAVDCLWLREKRWHGVLIGLAAAVKLTPLVFVLYLIVTRRWRAVFVSMATFVLAQVTAAVLLPGASWTYWTDTIFAGGRFGSNTLGNRSVQGMLERTSLGDGAQLALLVPIVLALVVLGMLRARTAYRSGRYVAGMAIVGCVSIAVSPISWSHHLTWILLAVLALARPGLLKAAIPLVIVLMLDTPGLGQGIHDAVGWGGGLWALVADLDGLAAIAVVLFLPVRARHAKTEPPSPEAATQRMSVTHAA